MIQQELSFPDAVEEAKARQKEASDPCYSVFVSASAGSGKTKLLIDRLLRLMMPRIDEKGRIHPGVPPEKIQCLTYSNAAAVEMSMRLQQKLSEWVGFSDEKLNKALLDLEIIPSSEMRKSARILFADILDMPGGMRIETNHAFCQSILQRFPLEARVIPQFRVIEEVDNLLVFKRAFDEKINAIDPQDIKILSPLVNYTNFLALLQELQKNQLHLRPVLEMIKQGRFSSYLQGFLGLAYSSKDEYFRKTCQEWPGAEALRQCVERLKTVSSKKIVGVVRNIIKWLDLPLDEQLLQWNSLLWISFTTKDGNPRAELKLNKTDDQGLSGDVVFLNEWVTWVLEVSEVLKQYDVYAFTLALLRVFSLIWEHYQGLKRTQGMLYYSDLIDCTLQLLEDTGAAWVLYKLDGGLDHILLDEVQDNSAEQWKIAASLSDEFFAGKGREPESRNGRTFFAVGDYKQSIYSFQGAQPKEFFLWKARIGKAVRDAGELWAEPQLRVSFRSSQVILDFVDQIFSEGTGLPGVQDDLSESRYQMHRSANGNAPGRVDLWPVIMPPMDEVEDEGLETLWQPLKANQDYVSPDLALAECLAGWIKDQIGNVPPYGGEPLKAGDILVLIRKRSPFSSAFISALKVKNVPLANLVKTQLMDQIAVQDLLVLCEVLLLPQDDLALACVLKSPLGGLDEESLMELAAERPQGQTLWGALFNRHAERKAWQDVWFMLSQLFARVDYVTPYALLVEILGEYRGRAKLLSRLGGEALEAIDELLAQALQYENEHSPSLQGFLYWLKQSRREIKNISESGLEMVRVMTVHGAKGLQGRLVILPDATRPVSKNHGFQADKTLFWQTYPMHEAVTVPLYVPNKDFDIQASMECRNEKDRRDEEESDRLLYVALTRASEWLLIAGWRTVQEARRKKDLLNKSWYDYCLNVMEKRGSVQEFSVNGLGKVEGKHYFIERRAKVSDQKSFHADSESQQVHESVPIPEWLGQKRGWVGSPLPIKEVAVSQYVPSRPEGIVFGEVPEVISPIKTREKRHPFYRGRLVHALLQCLPEYPVNKRYGLAMQWLQKEAPDFSSHEREIMIDQVCHVMESPQLQPLFSPESLAEQPVTGILDGVVITGQIDRMCVASDQVLFCDFKSGRRIPKQPETIPRMYLRQMAAYWMLLKGIYPDRPVRSLLIWTDDLTVMDLPDSLLEAYLPVKNDKSVSG